MKKIILTILVFLMLILSACGGTSPAAQGFESAPAAIHAEGPANQNPAADAPAATAVQDTSATVGLNTAYENAVSVELQLLLGTLKLDGDLVVTKEQASALLPLWNDLRAISLSMAPTQGALGQGSAPTLPQKAGVEIQSQMDALVKQILATMTPEQTKAIAEMGITWETTMTIMQKEGVTIGGPRQGSEAGSPPPQGTPPAGGSGGGMGGPGAPPQGTPPAGGPGGNMGGPGGGQPPDEKGPGRPAGGGMIPTELLDTLIQSLKKLSE